VWCYFGKRFESENDNSLRLWRELAALKCVMKICGLNVSLTCFIALSNRSIIIVRTHLGTSRSIRHDLNPNIATCLESTCKLLKVSRSWSWIFHFPTFVCYCLGELLDFHFYGGLPQIVSLRPPWSSNFYGRAWMNQWGWMATISCPQ